MKQNQPKQKYKKIIKNNQKWNDVVLESWRQWRVGWLVGGALVVAIGNKSRMATP